MTTYYIPVTEVGLVEFLSSGYIGIANSKVEYRDIHTDCWPSTVVLKELAGGYANILCEVEVDARAYSLPVTVNGKKSKIFHLRRPTSVGEIRKIHFPNEDELQDFTSKYHYMEDLNIREYQFGCDSELVKADPHKDSFLHDNVSKEISLVSRTSDSNINTAAEKQNLMEIERGIFAFLGSFYKFLPVDIRTSVDDLNCLHAGPGLYRSIANLFSCKDPAKSLQLILHEYFEICRGNLIESRTDQIEILEQIKERIELSDAEPVECGKANGFIDRLINIFMGMESHPDLSGDNSEKVFQFGFYVSLLIKRLEDITELRNRFRFSPSVEAVATYFFLLRARLSQISSENFCALGASKKDWTHVFLDVYANKNSTIYVSAAPKYGSLDLSCRLFVNDTALLRFDKGVSAVEGQVITTVQRFNVEPSRDDETGLLSIVKYVDTKPVTVLLEIVNFTDNHHINEVHVQYRSKIVHNVLSKSKTRIELLNLMSRKGVAIGIDEGGYLVLSRLQMVDTMDKDELWHHVEQVAEAGATLDSREW